MIQRTSPGNRYLKIALGIALGVAVALTLILLFVPAKEDFSHEAPGVLLRADGESTPCMIAMSGSFSTYAFDANAPICQATLSIDGKEIGELRLTFDGDYAVSGETGLCAAMSRGLELAAQIDCDGAACLLLSPAVEESTAQKLLAQFLSGCIFAHRQGWDTFQK